MNLLTDPVVVMIIDDEPENLNVLDEILRTEGWQVRAFTCGEKALAAAAECPPDLVLLDVRMPGMDGYETCRRFKAHDRLHPVPVIFLSAGSETTDKIRGFEAGGADYVTKPVSEREVLARSLAHIRLHRHQTLLEAMVRDRTRELAEANRRLCIWDAAKSDWINMLSHEMRTPLTGVFGVAELLFMTLPHTDGCKEMRDTYDASRKRIDKLIDDACLIAQIHVDPDGFLLRAVPLARSLRQAVDAFALRQTAVTAHTLITVPKHVTVLGLPVLLCRAWTDLLLTAACCVNDGEGITVQTVCDADHVRVRITTEGQGLTASALEGFFEVGGQRMLLKGGGDFGLGAALARRILGMFDGQVSVGNGPTRGIVLEVLLPIAAGVREGAEDKQ